MQERRITLATYHDSPKAYSFLRSVFHLPSLCTLNSWLRKITLSTGWSKSTLAVLKKKADTLPRQDTLCGIIFEAMSIKEFLHFDKEILDNWREDFGERGKSQIGKKPTGIHGQGTCQEMGNDYGILL